jgi:hypothetical protein
MVTQVLAAIMPPFMQQITTSSDAKLTVLVDLKQTRVLKMPACAPRGYPVQNCGAGAIFEVDLGLM